MFFTALLPEDTEELIPSSEYATPQLQLEAPVVPTQAVSGRAIESDQSPSQQPTSKRGRQDEPSLVDGQ